MWHCPHCGAPQAETARCWVCRRSSTTCSTCRHFRTSLAPDIGYCALDRKRQPLTGRELRGCWTERPEDATAAPTLYDETVARANDIRRARSPDGAALVQGVHARARDFIPVDDVAAPSSAVGDASLGPEEPAPAFLLGDPVDGWESRTSLFDDPER
jgi:hypothetical protein